MRSYLTKGDPDFEDFNNKERMIDATNGVAKQINDLNDLQCTIEKQNKINFKKQNKLTIIGFIITCLISIASIVINALT